MVLSCGCSQSRNDPFLELYKIPSTSSTVNNSRLRNRHTVSVSFNQMPFLSFVRWFSDSTHKGVIFPVDLEKQYITGEFKNATADELISTIARRLDTSVVYIGNTVYLGKLTKDDRGVLARKIRNFDSKSLADALQIYLSESGKIKFLGDHILFPIMQSLLLNYRIFWISLILINQILGLFNITFYSRKTILMLLLVLK